MQNSKGKKEEKKNNSIEPKMLIATCSPEKTVVSYKQASFTLYRRVLFAKNLTETEVFLDKKILKGDVLFTISLLSPMEKDMALYLN